MPAGIRAQRERPLPPQEEEAYGTKFFDELRNIFGMFRDADLRRAFLAAQPIQCSELVVGKGEWKTVAFFNEDRSLGEWCRKSIDEVKADLSKFTFKGTCNSDQGAVQLTTEFPVAASVDAFNAGRIGLNDIDINVNAPVNAFFDLGTQAYNFDLPYLFLVDRRGSGNVYSLVAPQVDDRYAPEVKDHWECKAVKSEDVTYRFLICRSTTVPRNPSSRDQSRQPAFGASAYMILSDGKEAQTSVSLTFGKAEHPPGDAAAATGPPPTPDRPHLTRNTPVRPAAAWHLPEDRSRIVDLVGEEFRLRFSSQTWTGKITSSQFISDQKMSSSLPTRTQETADYCAWRPATAEPAERLLESDPETEVLYSLEAFNRTSETPASVVFNMKDREGARLGTLQCVFPLVVSVANVDFDRWVAIVGGHLTLEIRR